MKFSGKNIVVLCAFVAATLCLAPSPAQKSKGQLQPAKPSCHAVVLVKATAAAPGEPVPGAEILIEQGAAVQRVAADSSGSGNFTVPAAGTAKFTVKLGAKQIAELKKKAPQADKVQLILQVTVGKKMTEHKAEISLASPSQASSGPFSQSLSNIEDN